MDITRRDPKRGGWTRSKECTVSHSLIEQVPDAADRYVLSILLGGDRDEYAYGFANGSASQFSLTGALERLVVPLLCETGRFRLGDDAGPDKAPALASGKPLRGRSGWRSGRPQGLRGPGEPRTRRGAAGHGVGCAPDPQAGVFPRPRGAPREGGAEEWMRELARAGPLFVPKRAKRALLHALVSGPMPPGLHLPSAMGKVEDEPRPMRPRLRVASSSGLPKSRLACQVSFDYGDRSAPAEAPGWALQVEAKGGPTLLVRRDLAAEATARDRLEAAGVRRTVRWGATAYELPVGHLARAVLRSPRTAGGSRPTASSTDPPARSTCPWCPASTGSSSTARSTSTGAARPLPELLAALRRGENTVVLGDGTLGMLPEEWLARYGAAGAASGSAEQATHLRFRRSQVGAARRAARGAARGRRRRGLRPRARRRSRAFDGIAPADAPRASRARCAPTSARASAGCDFLERVRLRRLPGRRHGLGKTVQVLALLAARAAPTAARPAAVAGRRPAIAGLQLEAGGRALHPAPARARPHRPGPRHATPSAFAEHDLVLTTYGTLRRDVACCSRTSSSTTSSSTRPRRSRTPRPSRPRRRGCSRPSTAWRSRGTPDREPPGRALEPLRVPEPRHARRGVGLQAARGGRAATRTSRARSWPRALRPFILRRTKEQVATDLPAKIEQTALLRAGAGAARALRRAARPLPRARCSARSTRDGPRRSRRSRCSRRCCGCARPPAIPACSTRTRAGEPSAKLDVLLPQLEEVRRGRAQGAGLLAVHELPRHRPRSASTQREHRLRVPRRPAPATAQARVERFQDDPDCRVVPHQPEGRRPGPEPDRGRVRLPARSVVEPRGRGAGHRPRAPHRPDAAGLRLPPDLPRTRSRRRSSSCRRASATWPTPSSAPTDSLIRDLDARGPGAAAVVKSEAPRPAMQFMCSRRQFNGLRRPFIGLRRQLFHATRARSSSRTGRQASHQLGRSLPVTMAK